MKLNVNGVKFIDKINEDEDEREKKMKSVCGITHGQTTDNGRAYGKVIEIIDQNQDQMKNCCVFF